MLKRKEKLIMFNTNKIGVQIANLRKQKGIMQEELAEKLQITPQAISKWENINDETGKTITAEILNLYQDNGLTFKIKDDGSRYRIFCYIKKSKESVIIGTKDCRKHFIVQLRITDRTVLNNLDDFSENIRNGMFNGPDCRGLNCRNCETVYVFNYRNNEYRKCHTLLCNFIFFNLQNQDIASLMGIIKNEIVFNARKA